MWFLCVMTTTIRKNTADFLKKYKQNKDKYKRDLKTKIIRKCQRCVLKDQHHQTKGKIYEMLKYSLQSIEQAFADVLLIVLASIYRQGKILKEKRKNQNTKEKQQRQKCKNKHRMISKGKMNICITK